MNIENVLWLSTGFLNYAQKLRRLGIEVYIPDFLFSQIEKKELFKPLSSLSIKFPIDFLNISIMKKFDMFVIDIPKQKPLWNEKELLNKIEMSFSVLIKLAVKNYRDIVIATSEKSLETVIEKLEECGDVPLQERRKLALESILKLIVYYADLHKFLSETFASEKFEYLLLNKIQPLDHDTTLYQDAELLKIYSQSSFLDNLEFLNFELPSIDDIKNVHESLKFSNALSEGGCALISNGVVRFIMNTPDIEYNIEKILNYVNKFGIFSGTIFINSEIGEDLLKNIESRNIKLILAKDFKGIVSGETPKIVKIKKPYSLDVRDLYTFLDSTVIKYTIKSQNMNFKLKYSNESNTRIDDEKNITRALNIFKRLEPSAAVAVVKYKILYLNSMCSGEYEAIKGVIDQLEKFSDSKKNSEVILIIDSIPKNTQLLDKIKNVGVKFLLIPEKTKKIHSEGNGAITFQVKNIKDL